MKISGYITLRNAEQMGYPFDATIRSLFNFCDEIVVCDTSDGKDKTSKIIKELYKEFNGDFKIINPTDVNWDAPNHGIYDGITKAKAREACSGDYCFQVDADEIVTTTREQVEKMIEISGMSEDVPIIALPVVEYWGSEGKVRIDVNPWKWRLSLNLPNITHGIPKPLRKEVNGLLYAQHGCDGCEYIDKNTGNMIPFINFIKPEVEKVRRMAITNELHVPAYEKWFNKIVTKMPTIYHFSWWSVYEKMLKYKLFWNDSWLTLYNEARPEGYNPFFNKPFDQVSDKEMIKEAQKIEKETAGHIFHKPWDGSKTNYVTIHQDFPEVIKKWAENHKTPK